MSGSLQRFSRKSPCPVCGGSDDDPRGTGRRCFGFLGSDRRYAHCTREEFAGDLQAERAGTFAHRVACRCADGCACPPGVRAGSCRCAEECRCCRCGRPHIEANRQQLATRAPIARLSKATSELAENLWNRASLIEGTPAERYLRGRGIKRALPPSLRFLAEHRHKKSGLILPVLLAAVRDVGGRIVAVHRIYLDRFGSKASVDPPKMSLGPCAGGAVRLAPAGDELGVSEGIETGLAAAQIAELPVWAALSAVGIESLVLPPRPIAAKVVIFADNDRDGRGLRAARKAAARWYAEGRKIRIMRPRDEGADFNDVLRSLG